jgi:hypothetical protein
MYDDLNAPDGHTDPALDYDPPRSKGTDRIVPTRHVPDREVPIPNTGAASLVHHWLDGDVSVAVVRATQGGNDAVDLWTKIHDEAETLRSRTTPLYVHKRIMDSLPDDTYKGHHPWYKRSIPINPAVLIVGAAALVAIGIAVAQMVLK